VANHTVKNDYKSAFSSDRFMRLDASGLAPHPPTRPFLSYYSQNLAFQMAEPFNLEQATAEARRAERDRQRRMIHGLPRGTATESFLANLGALHLDEQDRVQEALLTVQNEELTEK